MFNETILPYVESAQARGWTAFPCWENKRPACKFEYGEIPAFGYWADSGVYGVHCGRSGLIVIDIDEKFGTRDGITSWENLMAKHGVKETPDTYIVRTYSGGYHLYFLDDPSNPHTISAGKLAKDIDVRAGTGYVIGAGSRIGSLAYEVHSDLPVIPLPAWLSDALREADERRRSDSETARRPGPHGAARSDVATVPTRHLARMLDGVVSRVAAAVPGERNSLLYWGACRFGEAVNADRVDEDEAVSELVSASRENGLVRDDGEFTVMGTIYSAFKKVGA